MYNRSTFSSDLENYSLYQFKLFPEASGFQQWLGHQLIESVSQRNIMSHMLL
jgi:hypothetical protein